MINLETLIEELPKIGLAYQKKLGKLAIKTVYELLFYFPSRYDDFSKIIPIKKVKLGDMACVQGRIIDVNHKKSFKKWMGITEAIIEDETGSIRAIWFNQPYLAKSFKENDFLCLAGKVSLGKNGIYLNSPAHEKINENSGLIHTGRIVPVYHETRGLTSRWLRFVIKPLLATFYNKINEVLPQDVLKKHKLLPVKKAIWQIHFPDSFKLSNEAKARFAFEELFLLELSVLREKAKIMQKKSLACPMDVNLMKKFTSSLPFKLTDSQKKCSFQILKDLEKPLPMSRLLEGDVGSGKTVVATMATLNVVKSGFQAAFMAPTEILAKQHFKSIVDLLKDFKVSVGFLTGKESKIFRNGQIIELKKKDLLEMLKGQIDPIRNNSPRGLSGAQNPLEAKPLTGQGAGVISNGVDIMIGTHSLIQKGIEFKNLALVVVDEQHRFGVDQRSALVRRSSQIGTQINADIGTQIKADIGTQINADKDEHEFLYEDLTYKIRGAIFNVYNTLGSGHKEIIYQKALEEKLRSEEFKVEREKIVSIIYNGKKMGSYQPDFIIEDKVILELKALPFIGPNEKKQTWSYLKGSSYKLAFLVNFGPKLDIKRIIFDSARNQRSSALHQRKSAQEMIPHLLSMTATPIPRTLALTVYGDLDLSLIKEMPKNRKKVKTFIIQSENRRKAYEFIRKEVKEGKGVFVICPRIEVRSQKLEVGIADYNLKVKTWDDVKAVKEEYEKLSKDVFPDLKIAMMHGKMKPKEKEKIMQDFRDGKADILVSTSVVEVGVDVPRATVMVVEGAEKFGLAQLHQFRGRVGRSDMQSYCFLFTTSPSQLDRKRLKAMISSNNGFELAQKDLEIRGPGQLYGNQQWGIPDMAMQGLSNIFLVEKTREAAKELLDKDLELNNYPLLKEKLKQFEAKIHFE